MTDEPFKNRPEDIINRGLKAGIGMLPVVGGPLAEYIQFVIGDPAQERRDDFMRATAERLQQLEHDFDVLRPERLRENEQFQAAFIEATQATLRTAHEKKKEMLRNAIINTAIGTVDENIRHMFMQFIDRLTPLHISMLAFLDDPAANSEVAKRAQNIMGGGLINLVRVAIPALANQDALSGIIAADLENMKLADGTGLQVMMTGSGLLQRRSTNLGRSFLQFISDPETHKPP